MSKKKKTPAANAIQRGFPLTGQLCKDNDVHKKLFLLKVNYYKMQATLKRFKSQEGKYSILPQPKNRVKVLVRFLHKILAFSPKDRIYPK